MAATDCTPPSKYPPQSTTMRARAEIDRRSGFDRRAISQQEAELILACRTAGVYFMGIQKVYGLLPSDLCLFNREKYGTTLAIPVDEVTPERLIEHMQTMEAKHGTVVKKAPGIASLTKPAQAATA